MTRGYYSGGRYQSSIRATCPWCGKEVGQRVSDGALRPHGPRREPCPGSHKYVDQHTNVLPPTGGRDGR